MTDLQLDTLEARGLIRVAALEPELEYLFRHALLQDTAYESLLKQERRSLHDMVGRTLEDLYPDRLGELAAVLALHFEQAGDSDKAVRYLYEAGKFAGDRNAIVEAYDLFTRAAALIPERLDDEPAATREMRIRVQLGRARAGFTFLSDEQSLGLLEPLIDDAHALGDLRLEADVLLTISLTSQVRGVSPEENPLLARSLKRVSEIAVELGDPLIAALPELIVGLFKVFTGDLRGGVALLEKTAPQLERKHDFVGSSFALMALGMGYARLGDFEQAEDIMRRGRELADKGDVVARIDTLIGTSWIRSVRGDLDSAVPLAMQCTNMAEEAGASACVVASNFILGDALLRKGQFGDAKIALDRGTDVANALDQHQFRPTIAALTRLNAVHMGLLESSALSFDEAIKEANDFGDRWSEATIYWKRAQTDAHNLDTGSLANAAQMLDDFAHAAAEFDDMGSRPFLARVLRDWGNTLRDLKRYDESDEKLRRAITLFDEMGITHEADESRATLQAARSA